VLIGESVAIARRYLASEGMFQALRRFGAAQLKSQADPSFLVP
jgi:hypothetical protein